MPTIVSHQDKTNLRDAIIAVHRDKCQRRTAIARYGVSGRRLSLAVTSLEEEEKVKGVQLIENDNQNQLTRWIVKHLNINK